MSLSTISEAIEDIRQGKMIILVDDGESVNGGILIMAAQMVTPEDINFMVKHARGLVSISLTPKRLEELKIPAMVSRNVSSSRPDFAVSIEARTGVSTGISAADRATTILTAIDDKTLPKDIAQPGHIFPLRAREGGVLVRAGHTEASTDLPKLAGLKPAGVLCGIMNDDGEIAEIPELEALAKKYNLKIVTIADLIEYRMRNELLVEKLVTTNLPTAYGKEFRVIVYKNVINENIHLALIKGDISTQEKVLVRVHSQCLAGDVFGSEKCNCGKKLNKAMDMIGKEGKGVIVYIHKESKSANLVNDLLNYSLKDHKTDEELDSSIDLKDYGIGAQILVDLGIKKVRLLTNDTKRIIGIQGYGLIISELIPIEIDS